MVEDGYEFFAKRQLVTDFSAPNYCGEFDNAGAMMSVDETLMCSFQILKVRARLRWRVAVAKHCASLVRAPLLTNWRVQPAEKKQKFPLGPGQRPNTPLKGPKGD